MYKNHNKLKVFCILYSIILIINIILVVRQQISRSKKERESLEITSILYVGKSTWNNSYKEIRIDNKEAVNELTNYLNSLELIEEPESYFTALRGKYVTVHTLYYDITVSGNYLSLHKSEDCDCVRTEYYIVNSLYNHITGSSTAYNFVNKIIRKYGEEI